ncbi:hypothetical protein DL89DRAFT_264024 [Linderina pennispora]|uniref:Mannosyltransferase n=1 Tax=Linderina pennispora TaxID=61395 RepID=A0A1Y1WKY8_9FUNG|nr:uncharacterized protein DL89DRAFT_264024 [Linderina pennispora]ORX74035.1 hypothetical protein DL89DRAFT_264024 [Linderina pennispora]
MARDGSPPPRPRCALPAWLTSPRLFAALLAFRLLNVSLVQTYIHPDETWQSLEVAHRSVFGYGFVTWEWHYTLRGYAHPMMFAVVYKILELLHLDGTRLILTAPYILVAIIAAAADFSTYHFAKRLGGSRVGTWALACSVISWTMGSGVVRPLANSAETALTAAAFVYWPWHAASRSPRVTHAPSLRLALAFAALSCIVRPTSGALWLCAGVVLLVRQPRQNRIRRTLHIVQTSAIIGVVAIIAMVGIDRMGYGKWVFPPYSFYRFNVQEDLATWFGNSSPFYHLVVSFPTMFTSMLPLIIHGVWVAHQTQTASMEPALVAIMASFAFSLVGHMEYRFLYPLLPIGFMYAAVSLQTLSGIAPSPKTSRLPRLTVNQLVVFLVATNLPAMLYLNLVHQRGVVDVMAYLRNADAASIGFIMPCHSTPFYSHLHKNTPMWFLSCEPPLKRAHLGSHYCEADDFEQDPAQFLQRVLVDPEDLKTESLHLGNLHPAPGSARPKPSHLVFYDVMLPRIHTYLTESGYSECARFFNTHFSGDSRRAGDVLVYCI